MQIRKDICERGEGIGSWCVLVHGLGEHSGRYERLTRNLLENSFNVLRFDLRGHGRSEGRRGDIKTFEDYLCDLDIALKEIEGKRFHLIGHSMGGLIVLKYALKNPERLKSVVASAPLLGLSFSPNPLKLFLGKLLYRIAPFVAMSNEIDPKALSHDEDVVQEYIRDPLVHRKITVRWFFETMKAMEEVNRSAQNLKVPVLLLHGSEDRLTDPNATMAFYEKVPSDKEIHIYDGYYHEPFNEKDNEKVFEDLLRWLKRF